MTVNANEKNWCLKEVERSSVDKETNKYKKRTFNCLLNVLFFITLAVSGMSTLNTELITRMLYIKFIILF